MRATVQVRIDEDTREQANAVFERIGLDIPTAIRMFLKQSIESNGLPENNWKRAAEVSGN